MALNSGFERFEGSAYFGYDMEGEGHEAVAIIGQNLIEIRDLDDNPLSQWMAGTYTCNDQDIPYRAYFHGDEWLAPQDEELQEVLDRFLASPEADSRGQKRSYWNIFWILLIIIGLSILSFFALRPLTGQLLSPAIRESLDKNILATMQTPYELCNVNLNTQTHQKISNATEFEDFVVETDLKQSYARLPTGRLAINAEYLQSLGNVQGLISLLQLTSTRNQELDPANELLSYFPLVSRFTFLANAEVDQTQLKTAWNEYAQNEAFPAALYRSIDKPLGDYNAIKMQLGWGDGDFPAEAVSVVLTDEEWLSLFTFCEK